MRNFLQAVTHHCIKHAANKHTPILQFCLRLGNCRLFIKYLYNIIRLFSICKYRNCSSFLCRHRVSNTRFCIQFFGNTRKMFNDHFFCCSNINITHNYYCLQIGPVPVSIKLLERFIFKCFKILPGTNWKACSVPGIF